MLAQSPGTAARDTVHGGTRKRARVANGVDACIRIRIRTRTRFIDAEGRRIGVDAGRPGPTEILSATEPRLWGGGGEIVPVAGI